MIGKSKTSHDDVTIWKQFPRYWSFVRGIHRLPVKSPHKGQWRGALMFSLICVWIKSWVNNREAGDLRRSCAHYDVSVTTFLSVCSSVCQCVCLRLSACLFIFLYIISLYVLYLVFYIICNKRIPVEIVEITKLKPWWRNEKDALFAFLAFVRGWQGISSRVGSNGHDLSLLIACASCRTISRVAGEFRRNDVQVTSILWS